MKFFRNPEINPQGFLIIEGTAEEFIKVGFGLNNKVIICDNDLVFKPIAWDETCYYVCAINRLLCWEHLKEFLSYAVFEPSDKEYESMNLLKLFKYAHLKHIWEEEGVPQVF